MDLRANVVLLAVAMVLLLPIAQATATYGDAENSLIAASHAIKDAQSSVDTLNRMLSEAEKYGISSSSYSSAAASANSLMTKARAADTSAAFEWAGGSYDATVADETSAQNYANQAKSTADSATSALNSLLTAPLKYDITPDQSTLQLADGSSTTVLIQLASQDNRKLDCSYQTPQTSLQQLGIISPFGTQSFQATIQAPASGNGTMQFIVDVSCSVGSYMSGDRRTTIQVQYQPDPVRLAIRRANQSIDSAQAWIDMASGVISNASDIGMDTRDEIAAVATSKGLLQNARNYLQSAQAYISTSSEEAQAEADKANDYAGQAGAKASSAYEALKSNIETCKEAYTQMLSAQAEIIEADGIYTKLASVVQNLPHEMNASAAAQDVEAQRQKLDRAKNENSQAKTQLSAGYCGQSLNSAISARNDAADTNNQLSRVAERMKNTIVDALETAIRRAEMNGRSTVKAQDL